jgi:hypothetical protein
MGIDVRHSIRALDLITHAPGAASRYIAIRIERRIVQPPSTPFTGKRVTLQLVEHNDLTNLAGVTELPYRYHGLCFSFVSMEFESCLAAKGQILHTARVFSS